MFEIGNTLREARLRRGLDIAECEAQTKIRAKYLRALEDEDFDSLPAPAYVRGFLSSYAQSLGVEGRLVLDEYSSRVGEEPDREVLPSTEAAGANDRPHRQGALAGHRPRGDAPLVWLAVGGAIGVAALVWLGRDLGSGGHERPASLVPSGAPSAAPAPAPPQAELRPVAPARRGVRLVLTGAGTAGSWVELRRGSRTGPVAFSGVLRPGVERRWSARRKLWLSVGWAPSLHIQLNGRDVSATGGSVTYVVKRDGLHRLGAPPAATGGGSGRSAGK